MLISNPVFDQANNQSGSTMQLQIQICRYAEFTFTCAFDFSILLTRLSIQDAKSVFTSFSLLFEFGSSTLSATLQ